jgi:choline-glycine betaine transporter
MKEEYWHVFYGIVGTLTLIALVMFSFNLGAGESAGDYQFFWFMFLLFVCGTGIGACVFHLRGEL